MIVISKSSSLSGYIIPCNKIKSKRDIEENTERHKYKLSVITNNKTDFTLKRIEYKYDPYIENIIFLYTFDPVTTSINRNDNLNMLIYSLLSINNEMPEASIYLYTSKRDELIEIFDKYSIKSLEIRNIDNNHLTLGQENKFAQIGHARIYLIPYLLKTTKKTIIYMDNDTMIKKLGRSTIIRILKTLKNPIGYILETYITLSEWIKISSNIEDDTIAEMCRGYFNKNTINNGILIFPNNDSSIDFSIQIEKMYNYYLNKYGYFYGLDMFIFSLMMHNYKFKINNIISLMGERVFYHYYLFKIATIKIIDNELSNYHKIYNLS